MVKTIELHSNSKHSALAGWYSDSVLHWLDNKFWLWRRRSNSINTTFHAKPQQTHWKLMF